MANRQDEILKKGLQVIKEEELGRLKTDLETQKSAMDFLWIENQYNPERIDIGKMRTYTNIFLENLEKYKALKQEIENL